MQIRNVRGSDAERIYGLFQSVSITRSDLSKGPIPTTGFYEYPLSERDITRRVEDTALSLVLERENEILAYIIAYTTQFVQDHLLPLEGDKDPVLMMLQNANPGTVYADQLYVKQGLPAFVAGRFLDAWEYIVRGEKVPGVVTAIPQHPWKNIASTRFALHRGFKRQDKLNSGKVELGLFSKPYWPKDVCFDSSDRLLVS